MVTFTKRGIRIGETEMPLYSGAVHYWRLERRHWGAVLDAVVEMGFRVVETYIPWSVHEIEKGSYDFGEFDDRKDLEGFLQLCEEKKLYVIVRPGPHINAEMTLFGYPEWILADEAVQAKSAGGTAVIYPFVTRPFPIPSYASSRLFEETDRYFKKLKPLLLRHCYPEGGIIAIQADNETCYFFRDKPYVMDFSKDSIALYRKMLEEKYGGIEVLSETYGKPYESFSQVEPPVGYGSEKIAIAYYYDWVEYKEYQILYALKKITGLLRAMELPIPVFHNCAYQTETPISLQRIEQIEGMEAAGIDAYPDRNDTSMLKKRIRYMAGSSRLPFVPEFGSGSWFDRLCLLTEKEEEFGYLYAFMNGMKAVNFYMLAERDRWTGCPVTADGRKRVHFYEMFQKLLHVLHEEEIHKYFRRPSFLILRNYDTGRLEALLSAAGFNTLTSNVFVQGPEVPAALLENGAEELRAEVKAEHTWLEEAMKTLDGMRADYDLSDDFISEEQLRRYSCVLLCSEKRRSPEIQERLSAFTGMAGKKVICGREGLARLDEHSAPSEYTCGKPEVELSVHYAEAGKTHLLYAANTSGLMVHTSLVCNNIRRFTNILGGTQVMEGAEVTVGRELAITLPPYSVTIYRVEETAYDK